MEKIIKAAVERGASDLHIKAGDVFRARINGKLVPLTKQRLTPDQTRAIALKLLPGDDARSRLDLTKDFDCSWGMPGVGRFRVNLLRQRSSFMIVMRVIPFTVPTLDELGLPASVQTLAEAEQGLLIVAGPTGSGKTSTVAAMVNHINQNLHRHILTIEDPIEFLHRDVKCSVTQREVGVDTDSFAVGLQAALRQDPDVMVISELRDGETLETAIRAAETGHLVITAMPTSDVMTTVARLHSMFPAPEREVGRLRLSESMRGVVAQRLLPRKDDSGRVPVIELMVANAAVRACLRDADRLDDLEDEIEGGDDGMQTFAQHAGRMVKSGDISKDTAQVVTGGKGRKAER